MRDVVYMSTRRAYEFALDDIRLTLLSNRGVIQHIQQAFAFEVGMVGQPQDTFGLVPGTFPPGLVFHFGVVPFPEQAATAVRAIYFEQTRIVIDVAGTSDTIDFVFTMLTDLLAEIRGHDGTPAIGVPIRTVDYTELRVTMPFEPTALLPAETLQVFTESLAGRADDAPAQLIPVLQVRMVNQGQAYAGGSTPIFEGFTLDIRATTQPEDRFYYSGAPLDTNAHLAYLQRLADVLTTD